MKANRFQDVLAAGRTAVGHMLMEFGTRGIAQILENCDLDFVLIDCEHSAFTTADVADLVAWFSATTITPIVRVPQIEYHLIARTLDLGALGIMVPNVKNADEARAIVNAAKYAPLGKRGVIANNAQTGYRAVDPAKHLPYANQNTTIICQIESVEGVENCEEIASIPGIDALWVGHFDLTQSMGIPGQIQDPRFHAAQERVVAACRQNGLAAGCQPNSFVQAQEWIARGFNAISYSSDFNVYATALSQNVAAVRQAAVSR